jgi:hypothetical protein
MLAQQNPDDPYRIDLSQYYDWAIAEASYSPPGSNEPPASTACRETDIRFSGSTPTSLRQAGSSMRAATRSRRRTGTSCASTPTSSRSTARPATSIQRHHAPRVRPEHGNSWLYLYAWQAGGEMMNADRTKVTMTSPPVVRALRFMTDVYDDLGGVGQVNALRGQRSRAAPRSVHHRTIAMKIDGELVLTSIADWKPDMDFIVAPAPMPQDRIDGDGSPSRGPADLPGHSRRPRGRKKARSSSSSSCAAGRPSS